ncbi:hypothetical protein BANRA_05230 [Klebsiella pneumoniae]|nr:hypothetical protein BANRA_05230 [Klebsiella pneumoniae]
MVRTLCWPPLKPIIKTIFENLMAQVQDMIEGNLGANNTWVGSYGITIVSGGSLEEYLPESVYNVQ